MSAGMNSSETICTLLVLTCFGLGMCCLGMPEGWVGADVAWRAPCGHTGCHQRAFHPHQLSQGQSSHDNPPEKAMPIQLGPKSGWEHQAGFGVPELDGGIMTLRGRVGAKGLNDLSASAHVQNHSIALLPHVSASEHDPE